MINAVLSVIILIEMAIILWIDSRLFNRLTDVEDKYSDLCDEYESISTSLDLLERKFEAKILDDNAEWIINHVSSWGDRDKIGYEALPVIDALADARKALKRAHEYSLTDRDIVLVNREIYRQYKRLLKEY
ncbi:hypothetical protein [Lancefieldella rimae]